MSKEVLERSQAESQVALQLRKLEESISRCIELTGDLEENLRTILMPSRSCPVEADCETPAELCSLANYIATLRKTTELVVFKLEDILSRSAL